ncbi:hypothetical protein X975_03443, partial [Stegodyphus mimosarum]
LKSLELHFHAEKALGLSQPSSERHFDFSNPWFGLSASDKPKKVYVCNILQINDGVIA